MREDSLRFYDLTIRGLPEATVSEDLLVMIEFGLFSGPFWFHPDGSGFFQPMAKENQRRPTNTMTLTVAAKSFFFAFYNVETLSTRSRHPMLQASFSSSISICRWQQYHD